MSYYETHIGTAKFVCKERETIEVYAKYKMKCKDLPSYVENYTEWLLDVGDYKKYVIIDNSLYEIKDTLLKDDGFIAYAGGDDKNFNYVLRFHNGGVSFMEVVEDAFKNKWCL